MPRIFTSASDPIDFCRHCFPSEKSAAKDSRFNNDEEGPDGRGNCFGWDAEHPPYEGEDYKCHDCRSELTEQDN